MTETLVRACLEEGFTACDLFAEKTESRGFRFASGHTHRLEGGGDRLSVRAFWETGEPLGISLSAPTVREVKRVLGACKSGCRPGGRKENFAAALPRSVPAGSPRIHDPFFAKFDDATFAEIRERSEEALVTLPGLQIRSLSFSARQKKVGLANSFGFSGRYRKTFFSLRYELFCQGHGLEIDDTRVFFSQLNPERLLARAHNLMHSIAQKEGFCPSGKLLILAPEAAVVAIRAFARHFMRGDGAPKPHEWLGSAAVRLADNPRLDEAAGSVPFDDEGCGGRETVIINKGVFSQPISDIRSAHAAGKDSTGNGFRDEGGVFPAVQFSNLYLKPSPYSLAQMMREAGSGILVSMMRRREPDPGGEGSVFSAYGFRFSGDAIGEPVHFYVRTSFRTFWPRVRSVSKELRFFHRRFTLGSPYLLVEGKPGAGGLFSL